MNKGQLEMFFGKNPWTLGDRSSLLSGGCWQPHFLQYGEDHLQLERMRQMGKEKQRQAEMK